MTWERIKTIKRLVMLFVFLSVTITLFVLAYKSGNLFYKSPAPSVVTAMLGLLMTVQLVITDRINMTLNWNIKKALLVSITLSGLSFLTLVICYIIMGDYFPMAIVSLWIIPISCLLFHLWEKPKLEQIDLGDRISMMTFESTVGLENERLVQVLAPYDLKTTRGRLKCCSVWFLVVFISIVAVEVSIVAAINTYYQHEFQTLGTFTQVSAFPITKLTKDSFNMRLKCIGTGQAKGLTVLFEHGAGSNGLAFEAIQDLLNESGIRSCSYDRPGYGRSENGPTNDGPQQRAVRLRQLLQLNSQNGPFLLVGWSAGVEIIQVFNHYYPQLIKGMVFIDGYPNYLKLQAIQKNKDLLWVQTQESGVKRLLDFLRWMEPFGTGFFVGNNQNYKPETMLQFYTAYQRNYIFWNSQYHDFANPSDYTNHLTILGNKQGGVAPYNSSIDLNWPNITVPLLILASNSTINNKDPTSIYYIQCLKYLQKSKEGSMSILQGDHEAVYSQPQQVFTKIQELINKC